MAGTGFQFSPGAFRTKDTDLEGTLELFERYCVSMTSTQSFPVAQEDRPYDRGEG